jgi:hypothetical protein
MSTLDQPPRLPVNEFRYDPRTRKFYRFGVVWKAAGVNAALGTIDGIKATDWLKLFAVGR